MQDSVAGQVLSNRVAAEHPTVRKTWGDGGYCQHLVEHVATRGIDKHSVRRDPTTRGSTILSRRWIVERPPGWLMNTAAWPAESTHTWRDAWATPNSAIRDETTEQNALSPLPEQRRETDVMTQLPYYEVDVPIHHSTDQTRYGRHVFTGRAADPSEALTAAHSAYDRAVEHVSAGRPAPDDSSDGWAVHGLRPDWVLDWHKAAAKAWVNPNSLF